MPFNGSGTYNRYYSWETDAANGIKIRADRMDTEDNGFATALSNCVTRDGQSPATANIPMGGFKHTNVSDGSALTHYPSIKQVINNSLSFISTVGGTANAITLTSSVPITALQAGQRVIFNAAAAITGAVTINRDGLGAKALKITGNDLITGQILLGDFVVAEYDGTYYNLLFPMRYVANLGLANTWASRQTFANSLTVSSAAPDTRFMETDQSLPSGAWRLFGSGGNFIVQRNTAVAGDFSSTTSPITITQADIVTFTQPIVSSGASLTNLPAAQLTGTLPNAVFPATLPAISGANLTNLNASNLSSGTVPDARFPATLPAVSGAQLTSLNANQLTTGSVADARLSANVPLLNAAANTFTGAQKISNTAPAQWFRETDQILPDGLFCWTLSGGTMVLKRNTAAAGDFSTSTNPILISNTDIVTFLQPPVGSGASLTALNASQLTSGTVPAARLPTPGATTLGGVKSLAAVTHKFLTSIGTDGLPVAAQPVLADISDAGTAAGVNTGVSGATVPLLNGNNTYSGTSAFSGQTTFSKQINGPEAALVDGASIAWDLSIAQAAHVTLAGNRTLANPTNMVAGGSYGLKVVQDGTGTRTLAYGSAYKWPGGIAPTLSTTAGAIDILTFYCDGTNMFGTILKAFA